MDDTDHALFPRFSAELVIALCARRERVEVEAHRVPHRGEPEHRHRQTYQRGYHCAHSATSTGAHDTDDKRQMAKPADCTF
jgi:hypothetical protein